MKALNEHIDTGPLNIHHVYNMYKEFFKRMDYDWWYQVSPGDVIVDVGACVGLFSCHALDKGASKVYMIEPNREYLKVAMKNTADYVIDNIESPVVPVHAAIQTHDGHSKQIYDADIAGEYKKYTFSRFIEDYGIKKIDFLKIDCEGGEYNILTKENLDFISKHVKHMAIEVHLRHHKSGPEEFVRFRNEFLDYYLKRGMVNFMPTTGIDFPTAINNEKEILKSNFNIIPSEFMIYITNREM